MPITIVPIEDDKPKKKRPTGKKPRSQKPMQKSPPQKQPIKKKMGGGKVSKYRAKGGVIQKKAGKVVLSGMAARRNARRGNM